MAKRRLGVKLSVVVEVCKTATLGRTPLDSVQSRLIDQ